MNLDRFILDLILLDSSRSRFKYFEDNSDPLMEFLSSSYALYVWNHKRFRF